MRKLKLYFLFHLMCCFCFSALGQVTLSGNVASANQLLSDVNIDVYEYSSGIYTASTNTSGSFSIKLSPEKIYLIAFYKSGYEMKSFVIHRINTAANLPLTVELKKDFHSPNGLLLNAPDILLNAENGSASAFSPEKITPQSKSDSTMVIINRAITNQYLLVTKSKLNSNQSGSATELQQKANRLTAALSQHLENEKMYIEEEEKWVKKSKTTTGEKQLDIITNAQLALANRLGEMVKAKMVLQEKYLTEAAITSLECEKIRIAIKQTLNPETADSLQQLYYLCSSKSIQQKNSGMRLNREFETINKAFAHNYQEYIELLRYKNKQSDKKIDSIYELVKKTDEKVIANMPAVVNLESIENKTDSFSAATIQQAIAEDIRFANYKEDEVQVVYDKDFNRINRKIIGNDTYDILVNKKLQFRYLKNNKPITKITYEFETKRKYKEVMVHIRNVSKF